MNYKEYYENQAGNGFPVFRGYANQKGYGLGGIFKTLYRFIMPLVKTHALPALKKGAEIVGTEAVKTAANIANDAITGRNIRESAQQHIHDAVNTLSSRAQDSLQSGSGLIIYNKNKRKLKNKSILKKPRVEVRRLRDIFDR